MTQVSAAYLLTNAISAGSMITTSTADTVYTKASLIDGKQNKPFRFTATGAQTITIDFGGAVSIDTIAIIKHNFTSAGLTLSLSANTSNSWGIPAFTQVLSYVATNIYSRFAAQSYRYWRLSVTNAAIASICELYLGTAVVFSRGYAYRWEKGRVCDNDIHETEFKSWLAYPKAKIRTMRFPWTTLSVAQELELDTLDDSSSGNLVPFVLIPDLTSTLCLFGRKIGNHGSANVEAGSVLFNSGMEFREESPGKTVT